MDDYFKRPQIKATLDCVNIIDNESNDLVLNLYLQFENNGQSKTSISIDRFKLQLEKINNNSYSFEIDKKFEIDGLSFVYDTVKIILPQKLDTITKQPKIKQLQLDCHEIKNAEKRTIHKDSTDVIWRFIQGRHYPENVDSFSYHEDYKVIDGETTITGRKIPIEYKGNTYTCVLYPREADISYKVENEKIHVTYGQRFDIPKSKLGSFDLLVKPLIFIPDPQIEDKCVLPNGQEISMRYEHLEDDEIKFKNYSVKINDMRNNRKQIVYFFK